MGMNSKPTKYQSLINSVNSFVSGNSEWSTVLSVAKDIEPYDTNQDYCYPDIQMDCTGNGGRVGKNWWSYCGGCYDGYMGPVSWKSYNNLRENKNFKKFHHHLNNLKKACLHLPLVAICSSASFIFILLMESKYF